MTFSFPVLKPVRHLRSINNEFNRLVNDSLSDFCDLESSFQADWHPTVDISENDESVEISFELPGISLKDIHLESKNDTLTISGKKEFNKEDRKRHYHAVEHSYGSFSRSFSIPANVDKESISSEYKNGLLNITLPKKEESKARTIDIKEVEG